MMLRPSLLFIMLACAQWCFGFQSNKFEWELAYPELSGSRLTAAAWGDSGWVVPSGDIILISEDGHDWEVVNSPWPVSTRLFVNDICFGDGKYVVVCDTGNDYDSDGYLFWSTDGRTWNLCYTALDKRVLSVAYAEGKFVAIGAGDLIIESTDGINWTELTPNEENLPLGELNYLNGQWWAFYTNFGDGVYHSTDLSNWMLTLPSSISALCYGDEGYVAVGREQRPWPSTISDLFIYHSSDGITWTDVNDEGIDAYLTDCIFANGKYYALSSDAGSMWISDNGRDWMEASIPSQKYGYNAIEVNPAGQLLAVGGFGNIAVSDDGSTWTDINTAERDWVNHITYLNGRFIALAGTSIYSDAMNASALSYRPQTGTSGHPIHRRTTRTVCHAWLTVMVAG